MTNGKVSFVALLYVEASGRPVGQELLDDITAVNRGPIPDEHQAARDLPQQVLYS